MDISKQLFLFLKISPTNRFQQAFMIRSDWWLVPSIKTCTQLVVFLLILITGLPVLRPIITRWRKDMKFIFEWKNISRVSAANKWNFFFHEKINFICSNQCVIFFLLRRYECFKKFKKLDEKQRKNKGMMSVIYPLVRI